jgi:hypothetical protein
MTCLRRLAPLVPGAQGAIYDALRGVNHQVLLRELGLIPVNRVTAQEKGAKAPRRGRGRRVEKSVHVEVKVVCSRAGGRTTVRLFAQGGAIWLVRTTVTGEQVFVELSRVRTYRNRDPVRVPTAGATTCTSVVPLQGSAPPAGGASRVRLRGEFARLGPASPRRRPGGLASCSPNSAEGLLKVGSRQTASSALKPRPTPLDRLGSVGGIGAGQAGFLPPFLHLPPSALVGPVRNPRAAGEGNLPCVPGTDPADLGT